MPDINYYRDIRFVDDHPSSSDEFRGRPHHSVADTLVSILTSGDGGRAIGLEGTWGSGKSTVIDIARTALQNLSRNATGDQKYTVFVFDAWAHQGDPLRRVFLQELIHCLGLNDAVNRAHWNENLEALETRRKKITEEKAERLSNVAKATIVTLPFLPVAYALIRKTSTIATINLPDIGLIDIPSWILGLAIILIPFLFAAYTLLSWRNGWGDSWNVLDSSWWRTKKSMVGKSVIWAFTRQTDHVTTEQFIREEEATTVEFNAIFDDLVNDAAKRFHKVIIVFDNLDRLPPDLIQSSWATMRNFFAATPGTSRQSALKNVWLIVPFDRAHIESVFAGSYRDEEDKVTPGFIEKTFEIVLRVAPPILSNWHEFLTNKLKESFGEKISRFETHQIFKILDLYCKLHAKPITPRAIKAFVNTIAAQAKQWGKLIPLEHQTLYALYNDQIMRDIAKLQDSSVVDDSVQSLLNNPDWVKSLAAAHFNVHPDEALEFLLSSEIDASIREGDSQRLADLEMTSGFDVVLDNYVSEKAAEWAKDSPAILLEAAATFADLEFKDEAARKEIWRTMRRQITNIQSGFVPGERAPAGIRALMTNCPSSEQVRTGSMLVRVLTPNFVPPPPTNVTGKTWYALVAAVVDALSEDIASADRKRFIASIQIAVGDVYLFDVAESAGCGGAAPFSAFNPKDTPANVAERLVQIVNAAKPPEELYPITRAFVTTPTSIAWDPVVGAIQQRLEGRSPQLSPIDVYKFLGLLGEIEEIPSIQRRVRKTIKSLRDGGSLHGLLGLAMRDNNVDLIALIISRLTILQPDNLLGPGEHAHFGSLAEVNNYINKIQSSPNDTALIDKLANLAIEQHHFPEILVAGLPQDDKLEIHRAVFRRMVEIGTYSNLVPLDVIKNTSRIEEILGESLAKAFLKYFANWDITEKLKENNWLSIDPRFISLSRALAPGHYEESIGAIKSGLLAFSVDQWKNSIASEDQALRLLFCMADVAGPFELNAAFFDALKAHSSTLFEGGQQPTALRQEWPVLSSFLLPAHRNQFFKWLRDRIIDKSPSASLLGQLLELFGQSFSVNADFPERSEDIIRTIVDPLLADGSSDSLPTLEAHAQAIAKTLEVATDEDRQAAAERLNTVYSNSAPDEKSRLEALAAKLGLRIASSSPTSESESVNGSLDTTSEDQSV